MTPEEIARASKEAAKKFVADLMASSGPFCNFCGMNEDHAGHLVEGPAGVHICGGCAELVLEAIEQRNAK